MPEHRLLGCRTEPLASYLKALGVFRLVAEQCDRAAIAHWRGDTFVLRSDVDRAGMLQFFLDRYAPTPLVAPWNGGSGFHPKDQQQGIAAIRDSSTERLTEYRDTIARARELVADNRWPKLEKEQQVEWCRATLPDGAVAWIDAVVVLTSDSRAFPPLLGTGGNVGRLEYSNNFMQRIAEVLCLGKAGDERASERSVRWLDEALFGGSGAKLVKGAPIGQFDPGAAGGANSAALGDAGSLVNPWDFVLLLEGALMFASTASRRLSTGATGKTSIPFTVDSTPIGYPSNAAAENARGEVWAPVWHRPAGLSEAQRVIGEGRAEWRRTQARDGLDFVRAVSMLAVDRGIDAFARYAIVERYGQTMLAVPVGHVSVVGRTEAGPLAELDPWLQRIRRTRELPAAIASKLRSVDAAMFDVATSGGASDLLAVLAAAARLEQAIGRSPSLQDKVGRSVNGLRALTWLAHLDDGSPEFRVAAALAAQGDGMPARAVPDQTSRLAFYLRPVRGSRTGGTEWSVVGPRVPGLGERPLSEVLADVLVERAIDVARSADPGEASDGTGGIRISFRRRHPALVEDLVDLADGIVDDERLGTILSGLLLLDGWSAIDPGMLLAASDADGPCPVVAPAVSLLVPFFNGADRGEPLTPGPSWAYLLRTGRLGDVVDDARRRLRIARRTPLIASTEVVAASVDAKRLPMVMLTPVSPSRTRDLRDRVSASDADERPLPSST
jgi:CRISPR-associated protein Csx17